jgi:DNA-binding beta-propeller fold protein YncE
VAGSPIVVGNGPEGVAVTPDGSKVYVANAGSHTVSVIESSPVAAGHGARRREMTLLGLQVCVAAQ